MNFNSINTLQQQLQRMLGTDYNSYLENMRDWFGQRITKDFFDDRMIEILQDGAFEIHNEMMKQIIFHCNGTPAPEPVLTFQNNSKTINTNNNNKPNNKKVTKKGSISRRESSSTEYPMTPQPHQHVLQQHTAVGNNDNQVVIYQTEPSQDSSYITVNLVENDEFMPYAMEIEQVDIKPIVPVDWLYNAEIVNVVDTEDESSKSTPFLPPEDYSQFALSDNNSSQPMGSIRSPNILPNITHGYDIGDRLNKFPQLKPHFKQQPKDQPYLAGGSSIHGRFLLKAWECGLDAGVDPNSTQLVLEVVKEHIRKLVTEVVKQRRAFRMRNDKICHSIGVPYPNPYLRQGHNLFDSAYTSESTKMADVMQVPKILSTAEELERIAILQIASAPPSKNCRFPASRATLADLLNVIENDPGIIPYTNLRFKLLAGIAQNYKGFAGSFSYCDEDDDDDFEDENNLLPICSY